MDHSAQPSDDDETTGRILRFRPRQPLVTGRAPPRSPVEDLRKYESTEEEPDDFGHRMKMNAIAVVATLVLIIGGIWIAETLAHMRKNQDCILTGRSNCAPVDVPALTR